MQRGNIPDSVVCWSDDLFFLWTLRLQGVLEVMSIIRISDIRYSSTTKLCLFRRGTKTNKKDKMTIRIPVVVNTDEDQMGRQQTKRLGCKQMFAPLLSVPTTQRRTNQRNTTQFKNKIMRPPDNERPPTDTITNNSIQTEADNDGPIHRRTFTMKFKKWLSSTATLLAKAKPAYMPLYDKNRVMNSTKQGEIYCHYLSTRSIRWGRQM